MPTHLFFTGVVGGNGWASRWKSDDAGWREIWLEISFCSLESRDTNEGIASSSCLDLVVEVEWEE